MNLFFAYLIKSTVSLALLYCLFRLAMRNDKTHVLNRFLLLGILLVSAVLPFLNIQFFYGEDPIRQVGVLREFVSPPVFAEPISIETIQSIAAESSFSINPWLILYLTFIAILIVRLAVSIFEVIQIIKQAEKKRLQKIVLAVVKDLIQPFSFIKHIVISKKDYTENREIVVAHEYAHIKHLHAIDLLICEMFTVLHFFNPFMWLLRRDLKLIHEFQADQAVLNKGIDAKQYQLLVLQKSVGERRFAMANHFTQKPILKRLKMMKKNKNNRLHGLKIILFVPVLIFLFMAFGKTAENVIKIENVADKIIAKPKSVKAISEYSDFFIEIKKDGSYVDNKKYSPDEIATKAKAWQKTGREDILLVLDNQMSHSRIDEVRVALSNANVYHVNQTTINSDEIIYPAGDVSKLAKFEQGNWNEWWGNQLKIYMKDIPDDLEYTILYSFIIDKNGKVSDGHVITGCGNSEINEAYNKALAQIPDWKPAIKGNEIVSVYKKVMDSRRNK